MFCGRAWEPVKYDNMVYKLFKHIVYTQCIIKVCKGVICMPWKEQTKTMMREEFVKRVLANENTKSALCNEYGISRPTGDKWIKRYLSGESLDDKSRAPFKTANKIPIETEMFLVNYRKQYPAMGALKIRRMLQNEGYENLPSQSTINNIFKRNNCITKEASKNSTPHKSFVKENPNDMWQADFLGHFLMTNGNRCHPLNVVDDCSRFNLTSTALSCEKLSAVQPVFTRLFQEFGLPFSLLCDNGNPWGTAQSTGFTLFEIWLMDLGVLTLHCSIRHPQTQGKDERFNGTIRRELLKYREILDLDDAQIAFDDFRNFYNNIRPHHSLNLDTPAQHYTPSNRKFPSKIKEWEYPSDCKTIKVKKNGYISVHGQGYFLSEAFANRTIAIKDVEDDCVNLYYRQFKVARINLSKRVYTSKRIYLIENDPRHKELT